MKQRVWRRTVGAVGAMVLICGCVKHYRADAFTGPAPADVATLSIDPGVRLVSLDGNPVEGVPPEVRNGEMSEGRTIRLLPGVHNMVAGMAPYYCQPTRGDNLSGFYTTHVYYPPSNTNDVLEFHAKPRSRYLLKLDAAGAPPGSGENWRAIVIDLNGPKFNTVVSTTSARVADSTVRDAAR